MLGGNGARAWGGSLSPCWETSRPDSGLGPRCACRAERPRPCSPIAPWPQDSPIRGASWPPCSGATGRRTRRAAGCATRCSCSAEPWPAPIPPVLSSGARPSPSPLTRSTSIPWPSSGSWRRGGGGAGASGRPLSGRPAGGPGLPGRALRGLAHGRARAAAGAGAGRPGQAPRPSAGGRPGRDGAADRAPAHRTRSAPGGGPPDADAPVRPARPAGGRAAPVPALRGYPPARAGGGARDRHPPALPGDLAPAACTRARRGRHPCDPGARALVRLAGDRGAAGSAHRPGRGDGPAARDPGPGARRRRAALGDRRGGRRWQDPPHGRARKRGATARCPPPPRPLLRERPDPALWPVGGCPPDGRGDFRTARSSRSWPRPGGPSWPDSCPRWKSLVYRYPGTTSSGSSRAWPSSWNAWPRASRSSSSWRISTGRTR